MAKIVVSDPLEKTGLGMLRDSGHEVVEVSADQKDKLPEILADADALVVRSGTQVTRELLEAGKILRVVGRAGIGVDNVDIEAATDRGILVINAPTANLISATEHTFAMLLAMVRNVPVADAVLKNGVWDRKRFVGTELQGKKLGIVGFGRIGQAVARRGQAFDMEILAYDPFLDDEVIRRQDAEPCEIDDLVARADVVTLHVPLTDKTRNILNAERIAKMKKGAWLVNCARGGVVDEVALLEALDAERLSGAALDVFAKEPPTDFTLAKHPRVVATPHLGAQTREAQVRISTETAKMVVAALEGSLAVTAVNLPFRPAGKTGEPYLRLAEKLGRLASSQLEGGAHGVDIEMWGLASALHIPVGVAALKGVLERHLGETINYVNAERLAADRGLKVRRAVGSGAAEYPQMIVLKLKAKSGEIEVAGTLIHERDPRIVSFDGYQLEFRPKGNILLVRNRDVPGVVGKLGTYLGDAGINIAEIHLSRQVDGGDEALAVVRVDQTIPEVTLAALRSLDEVLRVDLVDVGGL